ncbi:MAG: hypothetical protein H0T46_02490 [Deltaproteobacteria bacterium]|nr:hypothetical protein [Deltaproteobacteria bacterium]
MIRIAVVVALGVLVAGAPSARAQPAGAQAEVLFRQGRDLMTAGKIGEACTAFAESQKLEPAVTTLLNLAACREKNNQLASAWGLFLEAERLTRSATDAASQQLHGIAQNRAQKLEPRLSTLAITVPAENRIGGLEIVRNGEVVLPGTYNRALPIDGGTYTIAARAPGNAEWSTTLTIGVERDAKTIEVPKLKLAVLGAAVNPTAPQSPVSKAPAQAPHRSNVMPLVVGVGALALLGAGLGFEMWARSSYDDAKAEMANQIRRDSLYDSANRKRYVAEGLAVAGVATAGVALWLYLRHPDSDGAKPSAATARKSRLVVTPMGVSLVRRF